MSQQSEPLSRWVKTRFKERPRVHPFPSCRVTVPWVFWLLARAPAEIVGQIMVARDTRFSLYMPRQARLISGTASAENLSRLFGLAVSPAVLRYVLIGDVPVAQFPTTGEFRYLPDHNLYVWAGHVPEHLHDYRIWFEPYGLNPVRFEIVQLPENVLLRVQYGDFRRLHNMTVPYRITIAQPLTEHRVVWHYREVQLNVEAPSSLFRVTVPVGTERIELD